MITNERITPLADLAAARYGDAITAWSGLYAQAAAGSDLGSARSFSRVRSQALGVGTRIVGMLVDDLLRDLAQIAEIARTDVATHLGATDAPNASDAASEAVSALGDQLAGEFSQQIVRDTAFLTHALRVHALQVTAAARARRIPMATAVLQARIGGSRELAFTVHDRGGARWPSRKFVRTIVRQALLAAYNESALLAIAEAGLETAQVAHLNPGAEVHGLVLSMGHDTEHSTYAEIRGSVFHPNADAVIVPHGAA